MLLRRLLRRRLLLSYDHGYQVMRPSLLMLQALLGLYPRLLVIVLAP